MSKNHLKKNNNVVALPLVRTVQPATPARVEMPAKWEAWVPVRLSAGFIRRPAFTAPPLPPALEERTLRRKLAEESSPFRRTAIMERLCELRRRAAIRGKEAAP